jgi:hypothetical protein
VLAGLSENEEVVVPGSADSTQESVHD